MIMKSKIKSLAQGKGIKNIQQFAIAAAIPWATAKNIWTGNLTFRHLGTLHKASIPLKCQVPDLYEVEEETYNDPKRDG